MYVKMSPDCSQNNSGELLFSKLKYNPHGLSIRRHMTTRIDADRRLLS